MEKQIDWEDSISLKTDLIITDSPIFIGWLYVMEFRKNDLKDVMFINDIFKRMNKLNFPPRYDIIFHIPPTIKPVDDGVRHASQFEDKWRTASDEVLKFIFRMFPPHRFVELTKTNIIDRANECIEHILKYKREKHE